MNHFNPATYAWAPCVPELLVSDINTSVKFYLMLGFIVEYDRPEKNFAYISYQGAQLMLDQRNGYWETGEMIKPFGRGINIQIRTDELDRLLQRLNDHHITLYEDKTENEYRLGHHIGKTAEFLVQDPDGYLLRFSEKLL